MHTNNSATERTLGLGVSCRDNQIVTCGSGQWCWKWVQTENNKYVLSDMTSRVSSKYVLSDMTSRVSSIKTCAFYQSHTTTGTIQWRIHYFFGMCMCGPSLFASTLPPDVWLPACLYTLIRCISLSKIGFGSILMYDSSRAWNDSYCITLGLVYPAAHFQWTPC